MYPVSFFAENFIYSKGTSWKLNLFLFRFNLDARSEHDDDALWEALEIAQLKSVVSELDLKLGEEMFKYAFKLSRILVSTKLQQNSGYPKVDLN